MIPSAVAELALALAKALGGEMDDHISLAYKLHRSIEEQGWKLERQP